MMATTINFEFRNQLLKDHASFSLTYCYQCGTCSGGCPVAKETGGLYNPRRLIEKSLLGLKEKLIKDPVLWQCTLCDTCDEACPQHVDLTEIFGVLKNLAVSEGYVPQAYKLQSTTVFDNGISIPFQDAILRRRSKDLGLEEDLAENISIPLDEVQALMASTGFSKIIEDFKKQLEESKGSQAEEAGPAEE